MAAVQAVAEQALVSGLETVSMYALFLFRGACTDLVDLGRVIPSLVSAVRSSHHLSRPIKIDF